MYSPLIGWSRMVFLAGIVLAVVLIIPTTWFPFQLGKLALFALVLVAAGALFIAGRGTKELVHAHGLPLALSVGLLPLVYVLSAYVSGSQTVSITGFSVEVDTVLFVSIAFLAFLLSFSLFRTLRTLRLLVVVIGGAFAAVVLVQCLVIIFGQTAIPLSVFADRSFNLVGKWNDLGIVTALFAIFLLTQAQLVQNSKLMTVGLGAGLVLTTFLLSVIYFPTTWWFVLVASLVIGLVAFMTQRTEDAAQQKINPYLSTSLTKKIPWYSLCGVLVSALFLLYGGAINTAITNRFPVSSLEVRPSYASTYNVISLARDGSAVQALLGTGPNTFSRSWIAHKPAEVNQSAFWNLDFSVGFSTLVTALGTVGLFGALVWLIPLLLVCAGIIRAIRLSLLNKEERIVALMAGVGSIVLFGSLVFYVPSALLIVLLFVLSGATFGFLWRQGRHSAEEHSTSSLAMAGSWALIAVFVVVSLWSAWTTDRRFVAQAITNQGAQALQVGNADEVIRKAKQAGGVEITQDNLRLAVEGGIIKMRQLAGSSDANTQSVQQEFLVVASSTIGTATQLSTLYADDYRSFTTLARVYDFLASLKVQGAYETAQQWYLKAIALNASAPDIPLALARLEASQGKLETTQKYLTQSLTLKPNYTDAIMLVVQLNVANNDIPSAIRAAQAAAQTAPGVAPIWFQLGLLYYASGDTRSAIPALEQAIKIAPDYANAKYFLGLSYHAQKKLPEALKEFEDLAKSNPGSAEVALILGNLRQGKAPFESAVPPITPKPATRPTAPLNE